MLYRLAVATLITIAATLPAKAQSEREITMTPAMVRDVTAAIQSVGYNCPLAKLAFSEGQDAFGTVAKVYCGPSDREGLFENAVFRMTFRPNGSVTVRPWNG